MLLKAVEAFQNGVRPPARDDPAAYAHARGGSFTTTNADDWLALHQDEVTKLREKMPVSA